VGLTVPFVSSRKVSKDRNEADRPGRAAIGLRP